MGGMILVDFLIFKFHNVYFSFNIMNFIIAKLDIFCWEFLYNRIHFSMQVLHEKDMKNKPICHLRINIVVT
jgi:hypothetical protein